MTWNRTCARPGKVKSVSIDPNRLYKQAIGWSRREKAIKCHTWFNRAATSTPFSCHHFVHRILSACFNSFTMLAVAHLSEQWKWSRELAANRAPRHPRDLAVRHTARMSCKAVCTTDGWSVQLTPFFSGLALSACLIFIPTWVFGVCVCDCLFWRVGLRHAAGKCKHVSPVCGWDYAWACESWMEHRVVSGTCSSSECWNVIWRATVRLRWYASPCYMQIRSDRVSLAACWEGLRTKSICLPLHFHGIILLRDLVSPWAQQGWTCAFFKKQIPLFLKCFSKSSQRERDRRKTFSRKPGDNVVIFGLWWLPHVWQRLRLAIASRAGKAKGAHDGSSNPCSDFTRQPALCPSEAAVPHHGHFRSERSAFPHTRYFFHFSFMCNVVLLFLHKL